MKKPVHNTHKGLSTQNKVTLLLFLQMMRNPDFQHVVFEDEDWEDATFQFTDRRIFLEVKDLKTDISLPYMNREIFPSFVKKNDLLKPEDRILIAGKKFTSDAKAYTGTDEMLTAWVDKTLKDKGYNKNLRDVILKTNVFEYNEYLDENLNAYLAPVLGYWLPTV